MPRPAQKKTSQKPSQKKRPVEIAEEEDSPVRLQRLLASAGFGSRRLCEELITEGRVEVDGKIVDKLGIAVDPKKAKIFVDGNALRSQKLVYYAVYKPVGVVTTNSDPQGRPRVIDLVPPTERVFPVGRLDRSSEGLILLTNDGDLAQKLAHPKYQVQKVYRVTVAGKVDLPAMKQMEKGIYIAEGFVKVEGAKIIKARGKATELEVTLREGKNREIRRIFARLGHKVQSLRRIAVGPLRLGETPPGAYRVLTREEVKKLRTAAEASIKSAGKGKGDEQEVKPHRKSKPTRKPSDITNRSRGKSGVARTGSTRPDVAKSGSTRLGATKTGSISRPGVAKPGVKKKSNLRITRTPSAEPTPKTGIIIGEESSEQLQRKEKKIAREKRAQRANTGEIIRTASESRKANKKKKGKRDR